MDERLAQDILLRHDRLREAMRRERDAAGSAQGGGAPGDAASARGGGGTFGSVGAPRDAAGNAQGGGKFGRASGAALPASAYYAAAVAGVAVATGISGAAVGAAVGAAALVAAAAVAGVAEAKERRRASAGGALAGGTAASGALASNTSDGNTAAGSASAGGGADALLLACASNMIYATGRMVNGYFYLPADGGAPILFAKKPAGLGAEDFNGAIEVEYAAKPELMPGALARKGRALPKRLLFEDEQIPCAEGARLAKVFPEALMLPGSALMRRARSAKTSYEIGLLRISGERMSKIFESLPALYRPGMTDLELSIALEREMRLSGDLAVIRSHGRHLEIPPGGSLLAGDNAAAPSPYDFAIGGAGLDPTVPVGANGAPLLEGQCLLVDLAGNFTGYMIDMSRAYSIGEPPEDALRAHAAALGIQRAVALAAKPGAVCGDLYDMAMSIAAKSGYSKYFMGHAQQSRFIGHGVGLDLDELPVIALNSKSALEPGMAIALEPKFTLPGIGAVGTENTFLVTPDGLKALCAGNDEITRLPPPARG